jgi:putative transposase
LAEKQALNKTNRAIFYRLYPNATQAKQLAKTFGCCRFVYNQVLAEQQDRYYYDQKHLSKEAANDYVNHVLKKNHSWLLEVDKFALTNAVYNVESAYKKFWCHECGYPKFKSKRRSQNSYTTNMTNNNIAILEGAVKLPKLGRVSACIHRQFSKDWLIKSATIKLVASGKYYVSVLFEKTTQPPVAIVPTKKTTLGLDYSSPHFYIDSNGQTADYNKYYRRSEKKLAHAQQSLSRKHKMSKNYAKQRRKVAIIHEHIANQRKDFCHKLSTAIAKQYDAVCVEDINLRGMAGSLNLGKSTNDNGFGMFRNMLEYKLKEQGKQFIVLDRWFPSTKLCPVCGTINKDIVLGVDEWDCPCYGTHHLRDDNAACNIRDAGLAQYASGVADARRVRLDKQKQKQKQKQKRNNSVA